MSPSAAPSLGWRCQQRLRAHLLMTPSAESFTRGGSQYTVAVSLPGSAIRSRESGQRILGGSTSAHRKEE